jgi:putative ABC transport system permease protein
MSRMLWVVGRLKAEVSDRQAQAEVGSLVEQFQQRNSMQKGSFGVNIISLEDQLRGDLRPALFVLLAAAGFVLLIACANVANLLLVRAVARQKEIAIRAAMGAAQWRLTKQFLIESTLVSILGGIAGFLLAVWGVSLLELVLPPSLSAARGAEVDTRVFLFTLLISLATGIVCGVVPSIQSRRTNLNAILKEGGRDSSAGLGSGLRNILVVTEIAMAVVLLVGAGLMINSFVRLNRIDMGFQPDSLLTMNLSLPTEKYDTDEKRAAFYDQLIPRLAALPGVESVAAINGLPVSFQGGGSTFGIEGRAEPNNFTALSTYRIINADYFKTMRIPLIAGRVFTEQDTRDFEPVAIISASLARISWPGEDPLGKRIRWGSEGKWMKIVGIVGDIKLSQIAEATPHVYMPYTQAPRHPYEVALKTKVDPLTLATAMRKEVWAVDSNLPVADVQTMEQLLASSISRPRFNMLLLGLFAAIALLLAVVGIYGVMSYTVTQNTREIGIRMALGARKRDVLKLVISHGLLLAVAGVGLGLAGAFALTRLMVSLLYGVSATDPLTFITVSALLVAVALLACYLPAQRASKVDPMVALRYE